MKRVSRPSRATSSTKKPHSSSKAGKQGLIRIIGGQWRGRKLPVLDAEGLRPTTDRNKETLFNWLMPYVTDARCLDVFAGSGGLGIEALSRYCRSCDFIELDSVTCAQLTKNVATLLPPSTAESAQVIKADALAILAQLAHKPFDIIFVDPPFHQGLVQPTLTSINDNNVIARDGVIYVEHEANHSPLSLPSNWQIIKEKRTSALCYYLIKVS